MSVLEWLLAGSSAVLQYKWQTAGEQRRLSIQVKFSVHHIFKRALWNCLCCAGSHLLVYVNRIFLNQCSYCLSWLAELKEAL